MWAGAFAVVAHRDRRPADLLDSAAMLTRMIIYGFGGMCGEVVYTALIDSVANRDVRLMGKTYLWMFPIYALLGPLYEPVHDLIRGLPWQARALVWSLGFTAIEHGTGWVIERLTGKCPWDYVAAGARFAINPYIRWDYFPIWAAIGLAVEPGHDFLVRLTPAIQQALAAG